MITELLEAGGEEARARAVSRAAEILARDGVVGLPTETVYGLGAAEGRSTALARLRELKERPPEKPFSVAFSSAEAALARFPSLTSPLRRLIGRFWPGPLTLVLCDGAGGTLGARVPGSEVTRAIIAAAGAPLYLPSANPAGREPAREARQVLAGFSGRIEAVVDGGRTPLGHASTVVRCGREGLEVLRAGILSEAEIRQAAAVRVLFVCMGNTCRSPMAAALLKAALARRLGLPAERLERAGFAVESAGLRADEGEPASAGALRAMAARSIALAGHRARAVSAALLDAQERVFVMTPAMLAEVRALTRRPQRVLLIDPAGAAVTDPFGGSDQVYEECARQLERCAAALAEKL
ncbi:MAG: Sua5/YciO/YrdC/YwlC family protein [Planctomycetes bacterium]|nr:Sua5/YciO/YrdC/YwlC family protein [Planctomycetota bacterium]